jgi:SAM-dependent methyltransferase
MSANAEPNLFDSWTTYAKVVALDYMFHRDIGDAVEAAMRARFEGRAFSLLDLGCGDASTFAPRLARLPLSRYVGVDLSATALALARQNLAGLPCPVDLVEGDLMDGVAPGPKVDAIYASFSLHHLATAQKAQFFRRAAARLAPGGLLLIVDVFREEDESLDVYYRHYCTWLRTTWTQMQEGEREQVCAHIVANDFPETLSTLQKLAHDAGLAPWSDGAKRMWHRFATFAPVTNA